MPRCSYKDLAVVWVKGGRTKLHRKDDLQGWLLGWLWWTGKVCADMNELPCFQSPPGFGGFPLSLILIELQGNCPGVVAPWCGWETNWTPFCSFHLDPTVQPWEKCNPVNYQFKLVTHPTSSCLSHPGPFPIPESGLVALPIEKV